ncbi:hypothetical protein OMDBNIEC_00057 [Salmonella phage STP-SP5]|nr:hypothetical protein OMDBNIEC_00057 [Salmonella phage STP-SP5]
MRFKYGQKRVLYHGMDIMVPQWANYVAVDQDGEASAFEHAPVHGDEMWVPSDGEWVRLFEVEFDYGEDWRESLVRVEELGEVPCAQAYATAKGYTEKYGSGYMQVAMDGSVVALDPTKILVTIKD